MVCKNVSLCGSNLLTVVANRKLCSETLEKAAKYRYTNQLVRHEKHMKKLDVHGLRQDGRNTFLHDDGMIIFRQQQLQNLPFWE